MSRGVQLSSMVSKLRAELRRSTSVAVGVDDVPLLKEKLANVQEQLYDEFDWTFLRQVFPRFQLQAGQRFYDVPDEMNLERIEEVAVWWGDVPHPLTQGIGFPEYSSYDSDNDERSDPTLKWDIRWNETEPQIEVWPVPASDSMHLQIIGLRKLRPLIANNDVCDLDHLMLVLYAAAELDTNETSSKKLAARAERRFKQMKGRTAKSTGDYIYGGGRGHKGIRPWQAVVRVR